MPNPPVVGLPPAVLERTKREDAKFKASQPKPQPEANKYRTLAYFEIGRYVSGNFRGSFVASQLIAEDADGKPLKKPLRKVIAEGVDMEVLFGKIDRAIRRRVYGR